ncbi:MAG: hypothetical protein JXB38_01935 [Anaerolineales bacterium]|nr:hypothetical protein [Anaerolineales bacterium]
MMKKVFLFVALLLTACGSNGIQPAITQIQSTSTITITPSNTSEPTLTFTPEPTVTITPTATPALPVQANTPVPEVETITKDNVMNLEAVAKWEEPIPYFVHYSPDGNYLAISIIGGKGITFLDTETYEIVNKLEGESIKKYNSRFINFSYSPNGEYIAIGSRIFDAKNLKELAFKDLGFVMTSSFTNDSSTLIMIDYDKNIRVWNWRLNTLRTYPITGNLAIGWNGAISQNGDYVALEYSNYIGVIDVSNGSEVARYSTNNIWNLNFTPNDSLIIGGQFESYLWKSLST